MDKRDEKISLIPKEEDLSETKQSRTQQTLTLFACMYLMCMSVGLTSSFGVLFVELLRYFDTERSLAALVQSFYQGMIFMGGVVYSLVVAKCGVGIPALLASLCGGTALFLAAFSVNIYMVIVLVGVVGGLSMSINYLGAMVAVGTAFDRHKKTALASLTMATSVGQILIPMLVGYLVDRYGWVGALMIMGGLMLNSAPCGLFLYFSGQRPVVNKPQLEEGQKTDSGGMCTCRSRKDVGWFIFLVLMAIKGTGVVEAMFIVDLSELRGYGRDAGTLLVSWLGVCSLVGRMGATIVLKLKPDLSIPIPFVVSYLAFGFSHFLVMYLVDYDGMLAACALRSVSLSILVCLQPGFILDMRGAQRFPKAMALYNFINGSIQMTYGYVGGSLADLTGTYELTFYIAAIAAGIGGSGIALLKCLVL